MSDLWEPCQFNDEGPVYCEPPSKLDAVYDDLLLRVTGNMLVEQKIEVAKMICNQLNENAALREQLAAKDEALREIRDITEHDKYARGRMSAIRSVVDEVLEGSNKLMAKENLRLREATVDCKQCQNRGRINGINDLSLELVCDSCIHYGASWRKDMFVQKNSDE